MDLQAASLRPEMHDSRLLQIDLQRGGGGCARLLEAMSRSDPLRMPFRARTDFDQQPPLAAREEIEGAAPVAEVSS